MTLRTAASTALCVAVLVAYGSPATAATACETLASQALSKAKIDSSQLVAAGAFMPPGAGRGGAGGGGRGGAAAGGRGGAAPQGRRSAEPQPEAAEARLEPQPAGGRGGRGGGPAVNQYANLPAFCRVAATLTPSSDSDIKAEVWLPASGWNGKFQMVGNGGWAGTIPYPAMAAALAAGYAAAGTDTGHVGNNADFALGHPEKMVDFGYRAVHETAVQAKAVMTAHYGNAPKLLLFQRLLAGWPTGIAAAQRYPEDFNGIIAGAAAWNTCVEGPRTALNMLVNKNPDSVIPPTKYPMIQAAVLNACDARDGLKDGVMENPDDVQLRLRVARLQGRRRRRLSDEGAGRVRQDHDLPAEGSENRAKCSTRGISGRDPSSAGARSAGRSRSAMRSPGCGTSSSRIPSGTTSTMNISTDVDRADKSDNGAARVGRSESEAVLRPRRQALHVSRLVRSAGHAR